MPHRVQVAMPKIGLLDHRGEHLPHVGIVERNRQDQPILADSPFTFSEDPSAVH
jgi:hypothetical protein